MMPLQVSCAACHAVEGREWLFPRLGLPECEGKTCQTYILVGHIKGHLYKYV